MHLKESHNVQNMCNLKTNFAKHLIALLLIFVYNYGLKAQIHVSVGQGIGMYRYYQGPLETHAFVFNNFTDVSKEMKPNRSFSGTTLGAHINLGRFVVGMDWAGKKNRFNGTRNTADGELTDRYSEVLNSFYVNFGIGNKVFSGNLSDASFGQKLTWRIQTSLGVYSFKLKEEVKGSSDDFNEVLGKAKGMSCRTGINLWYPIYKKLNINILPYYEFDTGGGYVEVLQNKIKNSEYFNITNFGININLDYAF